LKYYIRKVYMKLKLNALILLLIYGLISGALAQEIETNSAKAIEIELADEPAVILGGYRITLSEAIRKAIESNHDILTGKYDVAMADSDYQKFLTKYSPVFAAEGGLSSSKYPEAMWSKYGESSKSIYSSASLAKSFSSGTTVAAGIKHTYSSTEYPSATVNAHNPIIFASIEQEFLKNAFGYNDRKQLEILKNASSMQKDMIIYNLSLVVVSVIVDYWNVIINKNNMDNSALLLQETKRVRRIVADNVKLGLSEQFELNFWNLRVATSEASLASAQQKYKDSVRKFLQTVNMESEITMQEKAVLSNKVPDINLDEAIKRAYAKRADYLNAERALENAKLALDMYQNEALPSLKGALSISSMDYDESLGASYGHTSSVKYPTYEAKVSLTYPLDNKDQKIKERNARWNIEQAKTQLEKYRRIVKDDVTSKYENIQTTYELYTKAREARIQAELYYNKMLANLRRGRFTAASVREALDALIGTKEQELQLLVAYNASLLEFEVAKNELFETYKIDVEKYIPKEK